MTTLARRPAGVLPYIPFTACALCARIEADCTGVGHEYAEQRYTGAWPGRPVFTPAGQDRLNAANLRRQGRRNRTPATVTVELTATGWHIEAKRDGELFGFVADLRACECSPRVACVKTRCAQTRGSDGHCHGDGGKHVEHVRAFLAEVAAAYAGPVTVRGARAPLGRERARRQLHPPARRGGRAVTAGLPLRPYQEEALDALYAGWTAGLRRQAVVLPTGMGKTVVFAHLIKRALAEGRAPVVLVHREELAQQAADKIRSVIGPETPVGIVKAERDDVGAAVVVASVPTLAHPARMARYLAATSGRPRMVIVDEAHHAAARTWGQVLDALGSFENEIVLRYETPTDTRTAGFTATLSREDGKGLGDVWEAVAYQRDILYGIEHGYLTDVRGKAVTVDGLDMSTIARNRGDYQDGALGDAMIASDAGTIIAKAYAEHAADRPGVLFAPTVAAAYAWAADLRAAGITAETIEGNTSLEDRTLIYKRHAAGDTQVLANCMVLTEGWDSPRTSCAVIARPTQSAGLYVQMVGRVLRPFPGKPDALVLDVVGVSARHALASLVDLSPTAPPREGETLAEAVARVAATPAQRKAMERKRAAGQLGALDVDLFHRSASVWLQTYAGVWFVPTKEWTYFLWPETGDDELWRIGRKPTGQNRGADRGGWVRDGLTLGYAMALGEAEAAEQDASVSSKKASWRRKSNKPSEAQDGLLARYGLYREGLNRSEASDLISIHLASRDLDPRK